MTESKLEYYLGVIPAEQVKVFKAQLAESGKLRDQILFELLNLVLNQVADQKVIYETIYPGKPFSEKQIRNLRSELLHRLISFITHSYFDASQEKDILWLRIMNDLGAVKYAEGGLKKVEKKVKAQPLSIDQIQCLSQIELEKFRYEWTTKGRKSNYYGQLMQIREEVFVVQSLQMALGHRERYLLTGEEQYTPPISLLGPILQTLEQGGWQNSTLIQLYYSAYLLSYYGDQQQLKSFVDQLISNAPQIDNLEILNLYTIAQNHCVRIWKTGEEAIYQVLFELNEAMIELEVFLTSNGITPGQFRVIIACALQLGKLNWANRFIDQFGPYTPVANRAPFLSFCQGLVSFHAGSFKESETLMNYALDLNKDPFLGLDVRSYLLRIYYETEDHTGMESMVNSYRLHLRRYKDLPANRLTTYKEFVRLFRRLMTLKPDAEKQHQALKEEVINFSHLSSRKWFLSKLTS